MPSQTLRPLDDSISLKTTEEDLACAPTEQATGVSEIKVPLTPATKRRHAGMTASLFQCLRERDAPGNVIDPATTRPHGCRLCCHPQFHHAALGERDDPRLFVDRHGRGNTVVC
jgi:hypothetical protein